MLCSHRSDLAYNAKVICHIDRLPGRAANTPWFSMNMFEYAPTLARTSGSDRIFAISKGGCNNSICMGRTYCLLVTAPSDDLYLEPEGQ